MSVGFDWDKEDENRRERQKTDEYLLELKALKQRRTRMAILGFLAIPALVIGLIYLRDQATSQAIHEAFQQTIDGEIRALRTGDKSTWLGYQANVKPWSIVQWNTYGDYQSQRSHVVPGNRIVDEQNDDLHGQVQLEELVDGAPYEVTWYYDYSEHDGWKHVAPPLSAFGAESQLSDDHFTIRYRNLDAAQVDAIKLELEGWWKTACQMTECGSGGPQPLTIRLATDPALQPGWSTDDPSLLNAPSPHLGRVPADNTLNPEYRAMLARLVGQYWARWAAPVDAGATVEARWFQDELAAYLAHGMGVKENAPLLGRLAGTSGPKSVMALGRKLKGGEDLIPALRDVTGLEPLEEPFDWHVYLAAQLNAEASLAATGQAGTAARLYGDPDHLPTLLTQDGWQPADALAGAAPGSIQVGSVDQVGDLYWAQVTFGLASTSSPQAEANSTQLAAYVPFRIMGDRWLHTQSAPVDFGAGQDSQSAHVALHVSALDADAAGSTLADDLEPVFVRAATELGIDQSEIGGLDIRVLPAASVADAWSVATPLPFEASGKPITLSISTASPHLASRSETQTAREWLKGQIIRNMVIEMVRYRAYTISPRAPLPVALARWEMTQLGADADTLLPMTDQFLDGNTGTLEQLWTRDQGGPFILEDQIGAQALVGLLVEEHGPQAVAKLLAHMAEARDMDGWLTASLEITSADVRTRWTSATAVAINAAGGRSVQEAAKGPDNGVIQGNSLGTVDVVMSDSGKTIVLRVGETFQLNLDANPDHFWSIKIDDPAVIALAHQVDAATGAQWTYQASQIGQTRLTANGTWACKLNPGATCSGLPTVDSYQWLIIVQ